MPYEIPTVRQLYDRITGDINAKLPGADARPRRSLLGTLAAVKAAATWGLYRYQEWIARQIFVATADVEALTRHADFYRVPRKAATFATRTLRLTGVAGSIIDKGTSLRRSGGAKYITTDDALIGSDGADVLVRAAAPGVAANAAVGETLSLTSPVAGVTSTATVVGLGDEGYDQETIEAWRARIAEVRQKPPRGGDVGDYGVWAKEVVGVTRAWCYPGENGIGSIVVRICTDGVSSNGMPSTATLVAVQAYIDSQRPVGPRSVLVAGWIEAPIDFTIGVVANRRAAVATELAALFAREAKPGATMRIGRLRAAVSAAAPDYTMTAPSTDVPHAPHQMPVLGVVTWA